MRGVRIPSKPRRAGSARGARSPLTALLAAGALALAACASEPPPAGASGTPDASGAEGAASSPPSVSAPPPGTPLAKVRVGMDDERVEEILGNPSRQTVYHTFKAWIPFYQGGDDRRYEWRYPEMGRVTFNQNRYSGDLQVIRVDYDPEQPSSDPTERGSAPSS